MLELKRLNSEAVWVNPDTIKLIFKSPDTTLVFIDESTMTVKNSVEEIRQMWMDYRRSLGNLEVKS